MVQTIDKKNAVIIARGKGFGSRLTATNQKTYHIAKILNDFGYQSYIYSSIYTADQNYDIPLKAGHKNGVIYYNPIVLQANLSITDKFKESIKYCINIYTFLRKISGNHKQVCLIFYRQKFLFHFILLFSAKLNGISLIYNIEEWYVAHKGISRLSKFKNRIIDYFSFKTSRSVIAISKFITDKALATNSKLNSYILPSIADYRFIREKILTTGQNEDESKYILYCGALSYYEVIDYIIEAFTYIREKNISLKLVLIVYGPKSSLDTFKEHVSDISNGDIRVLNNLSNEELFRWYASAFALLAPLRNTEQDRARFPQKIAEYAATGRPIITNPVGDISEYFSDNKSAVFMDNFSHKELAEKINYLLNNEQIAGSIGSAGKKVGERYFNYSAHVEPLGNFVNKTLE